MIDKSLMALPGMKKIIGLLAGLAVLQALFIIGQGWTLAAAITGLWSGGSLSAQVPWMAGFFIVYLGRHLITYLRETLLDRYAATTSKELRQQLLTKVFRLGPQIVQAHGTGNMTTMALDGIDQVENYLQLILAKLVNMAVIPWLILVTIFLLDVQSGLVLLLVFPLIILFMIILGKAAKSKADTQFHAFQILSNHFIDSLRGISTLKLFGLSKSYSNSIYKTSEQFRKATMNTLKIAVLSTFALDFFTTLSVAVVAVFLGLRLLDGLMPLFPALTVLILAPEYFLPIRDFSGDYHATLDGKNAFHGTESVLKEPEIQSQPVTIGKMTEGSEVAIEQVGFSYGEQLAGLKDISLTTKGYQKVGIVGMSGSGKSTLINLLSGFLQPSSGVIEINGSQSESFQQPDWQQQVIYIPQDPYVFQMSFRENIAFYRPDASDEQILEAVAVAGLAELLADLPDGLDTQLGEGMRQLSGGQAQRIALARAFLDQDRRVLMFDEPTAHLDIETEVELKERMLPLMADRLVFFATHRLHWMEEMDWIVVMEQGQIVEQGTLQDLREKNGAFAELTRRMAGEVHG